MKSRILPIFVLTFAGLLFSRTAALSSEVVMDKSHANESISLKKAPPANTAQKESNDEKQCLTGAVLEVLNADTARLDARKSALAERETILAAIETKLQTQMQAIEIANNSLQSKIDVLKTTANDDLKHLVGMYQAMKPKEAAEIFDSMDPAFAAGFLREMSSDKAGLIMANMDPRKSYAISVIMASRNAKYRKS